MVYFCTLTKEFTNLRFFDMNGRAYITSYHREIENEKVSITEAITKQYGDEKTPNEIKEMVKRIYSKNGL